MHHAGESPANRRETGRVGERPAITNTGGTMSKAKELVKAINAAKVCSPCFLEDEIEMGGATEVATIELDEHRWYVIGTVVFRVGDEFFGVRGPTSLKSEAMGFADVEWECEAFEMEQVPSVTYKRK